MAVVSMRVVYPSVTAGKIDDKLVDVKANVWDQYDFEKPTRKSGSTVF